MICSLCEQITKGAYFVPEGVVFVGQYHGKRRGTWKRGALITAGTVLIAFLVWWSNASVQTETAEFSSVRLPAAFHGLRIAVLSDLHSGTLGEKNRRLLSAVSAAEPDMIAVVGDLEDCGRGHDQVWVEHLATELTAIAPVYYVTGNHEWAIGHVPELKKTLSEAGWSVLSNAVVPIEKDGETIWIAGVDDPNGYADQKSPETVAANFKDTDAFWVLLAHRNNLFENQYSLLGADLTISGHGHGGVIRLPLTDGLISAERTLFPSYTDGFYEANGATVFVSRGVGNSGRLLRLFNPPQVAVITLRSGT